MAHYASGVSSRSSTRNTENMDSVDFEKKNLYETIVDLRFTVSHLELQLEKSRKEIENLEASKRRLQTSGYMGYNPEVDALKRKIQNLNASLDKKKEELEKRERVIKGKDFEIEELKQAQCRLIREVQESHDRKLREQDIKIDEQDIKIHEQRLEFTMKNQENKEFREQIIAKMNDMLDNDQRNAIKQKNSRAEQKGMTKLPSGSSSDAFDQRSHIYYETEAMSGSDGMDKKTLHLNIPLSTSPTFKSKKKKKNEKSQEDNEEMKSRNEDGTRLSNEFIYPPTPSLGLRASSEPLPPISGRAQPRKLPPISPKR